jgi:Lon protease-like protein
MSIMATKQLTIPMFPLNVVVLPGETFKLHIYEERYKQLINDCLENEAHFGIPFSVNGKIKSNGVEVSIKKVLKVSENGEMDILIKGERVFTILEFSSVLKPKLYGAAIIEYEDHAEAVASTYLQELAIEYLSLSQNKTIDYETFKSIYMYEIANMVQLSAKEKFQLISIKDNQDKENYLCNTFRQAICIFEKETELKDRFIFN